MKQQKIIWIEEEIIKDIKENVFINFSEWVEKKYCEEFNKDILIEKYKKEIERLENLKTEKIDVELTKDEKRFFIYEKGFNNFEQFGKGLLKRFNNTYNKDLDLKQFTFLKNKYRG